MTATTKPAPPTTSLLDALVAFQADAPHIPLDTVNPHYKSRFASLATVMAAVRPKLSAVGLVWTTLPDVGANGATVLRYQLAHAATGETLEGEMPLLLAKPDAQGLGSAITYARRYAVLAVLGLVADDDDDGNAASTPAPPVAVKAAPAAKKQPPDSRLLTDPEIKRIHDLLAPFGDRATLMRTAAGIAGDGKSATLGQAKLLMTLIDAENAKNAPEPKESK